MEGGDLYQMEEPTATPAPIPTAPQPLPTRWKKPSASRGEPGQAERDGSSNDGDTRSRVIPHPAAGSFPVCPLQRGSGRARASFCEGTLHPQTETQRPLPHTALLRNLEGERANPTPWPIWAKWN